MSKKDDGYVTIRIPRDIATAFTRCACDAHPLEDQHKVWAATRAVQRLVDKKMR